MAAVAVAVLTWPDKGPDETLDYELDWTVRLAGDTIASSQWTIPADLTPTDQSETATSTTLWLSGGIVGKVYACLNQVVTAGNRALEQTVLLPVVSK